MYFRPFSLFICCFPKLLYRYISGRHVCVKASQKYNNFCLLVLWLNAVKTFFKQNFLNKIYFPSFWQLPNICVISLTEIKLNDKCRCQWSLIKLLLLFKEHIIVCEIAKWREEKRFIDGHLRQNPTVFPSSEWVSSSCIYKN